MQLRKYTRYICLPGLVLFAGSIFAQKPAETPQKVFFSAKFSPGDTFRITLTKRKIRTSSGKITTDIKARFTSKMSVLKQLPGGGAVLDWQLDTMQKFPLGSRVTGLEASLFRIVKQMRFEFDLDKHSQFGKITNRTQLSIQREKAIDLVVKEFAGRNKLSAQDIKTLRAVLKQNFKKKNTDLKYMREIRLLFFLSSMNLVPGKPNVFQEQLPHLYLNEKIMADFTLKLEKRPASGEKAQVAFKMRIKPEDARRVGISLVKQMLKQMKKPYNPAMEKTISPFTVKRTTQFQYNLEQGNVEVIDVESYSGMPKNNVREIWNMKVERLGKSPIRTGK